MKINLKLLLPVSLHIVDPQLNQKICHLILKNVKRKEKTPTLARFVIRVLINSDTFDKENCQRTRAIIINGCNSFVIECRTIKAMHVRLIYNVPL